MRHRGLDGIGMRDGHDDVPGVTGHDAVDGARDARLHLGEGLAAGEVEAARVLLDRFPLVGLVRVLQRHARELADVQLEQAALDAHGLVPRLGDDARRLTRALQRRGVDGHHLVDLGDALRGVLRLLAPLVGEMKARRAAG